jgi:hypothetical protein
MVTTFDIAFIDNNEHCDRIAFYDLSIYNTDIPVKTPIIKILYPDFQIPESLSYEPNKINIVNTPISDGLYTLEFSVCPNDKVKKTYYYFKTCNLMSQLQTKLCQVSGNKDKVLELVEQFKYIYAIKMIAEKEPQKAIIMYNSVKNKLC